MKFSFKIPVKITARYANFILIEVYDAMGRIPVGELDDEELEEYAEKYKQGFIEHAKRKREEY